MINANFAVKNTTTSFTYISPISKNEFKFSRLNYKQVKEINSIVAFEARSTLYEYLIDLVTSISTVTRDEILKMELIEFEDLIVEIFIKSTGSIKPKAIECSCKYETEFNIDLNDIQKINLEYLGKMNRVKLDDQSYIDLKSINVENYLTLLKLLDIKFGSYGVTPNVTETDTDLVDNMNPDNKLDLLNFALASFINEICTSIDEQKFFKLGLNGVGDNIGFDELQMILDGQDYESELIGVISDMSENIPTLALETSVKCDGCGHIHNFSIVGLPSFF